MVFIFISQVSCSGYLPSLHIRDPGALPQVDHRPEMRGFPRAGRQATREFPPERTGLGSGPSDDDWPDAIRGGPNGLRTKRTTAPE
jgi:hypothetical protein